MSAHLEGRVPRFQAEYRLRARTGEWIWIFDAGQGRRVGLRGPAVAGRGDVHRHHRAASGRGVPPRPRRRRRPRDPQPGLRNLHQPRRARGDVRRGAALRLVRGGPARKRREDPEPHERPARLRRAADAEPRAACSSGTSSRTPCSRARSSRRDTVVPRRRRARGPVAPPPAERAADAPGLPEPPRERPPACPAGGTVRLDGPQGLRGRLRLVDVRRGGLGERLRRGDPLARVRAVLHAPQGGDRPRALHRQARRRGARRQRRGGEPAGGRRARDGPAPGSRGRGSGVLEAGRG